MTLMVGPPNFKGINCKSMTNIINPIKPWNRLYQQAGHSCTSSLLICNTVQHQSSPIRSHMQEGRHWWKGTTTRKALSERQKQAGTSSNNSKAQAAAVVQKCHKYVYSDTQVSEAGPEGAPNTGSERSAENDA